ncbi:DUF5675 family protein [Runella zeae]|uniref:DUF5675 family protein n=1 Tax=Runella zeae TaxID=94255 RepID=UPI000416BCC4|nr:DUF5675 family protein [Runella zeae]
MSDLITIQRYNPKSDWTISRVFIDGVLDGFAVEDEIREKKLKGETAIWYGRYKLGHRYSPKFSKYFLWSEKAQKLIPNPKYNKKYNEKGFRELHKKYDDWKEHQLIWVLNVPQFEFILIHWGNTDLDSDGCIIIGRGLGVVKGREGVLFSQSYYIEFYEKVFPLVAKGEQYINIEAA